MIAIPPEQMEVYKQSARQRAAQAERHQAERRQQAWQVARQAADLLKASFGATRIIVFGSLAHTAWFSARSDIDLAVYGVAPRDFWRAWCALDRLAGSFEIDLVAGEAASPRLLDEIARYGAEL